jgi:hypothetical protein
VYAVIRTYEGITSIDEVMRKIESGWLPQIKAMPGVVGYHVVDAGNGAAASVSIFEDQGAAEQSSQRASSWLVESIGPLAPNPPDIIAGDVRVSFARESSRRNDIAR